MRTQVGFEASLPQGEPDVARMRRSDELRGIRRSLLIALALTLPVVAMDMSGHLVDGMYLKSWLFYEWPVRGMAIAHLLEFLLATPVQFGVGRRFYVSAYKALKHKSANMDVLVALGTSCAYFYSVLAIVVGLANAQFRAHMVYFETSTTLITFILLGKYLETLAKGRTSDAIQQLMQLAPSTAVLLNVSLVCVVGVG
jgi:Cu+-exporting ATPase